MAEEYGKGEDTPRSVPRATSQAYVRKKRLDPGRHGEELKVQNDGRGKRPDARQAIRFATWNVGSMTKRSLEVCEAMHRRRVNVGCVQEVRWKGSGTRLIGGYKFFWEEGRTGTAGVGVLVRTDWVDRVVEVERVNDRMMTVGLSLIHI